MVKVWDFNEAMCSHCNMHIDKKLELCFYCITLAIVVQEPILALVKVGSTLFNHLSCYLCCSKLLAHSFYELSNFNILLPTTTLYF